MRRRLLGEKRGSFPLDGPNWISPNRFKGRLAAARRAPRGDSRIDLSREPEVDAHGSPEEEWRGTTTVLDLVTGLPRTTSTTRGRSS